MNKYLVCFETKNNIEIGLMFEIDVSVNRPNNPTDDEIIRDYLEINYGNSVDYDTLKCHMLDSIIHIDEDYCIEI